MKLLSKYKNNFMNLFCAFTTYIAFLVYFNMIFEESSYNFLMTCLFFFLYIFYSKENSLYVKNENRSKKIVNIYSVFLGMVLSVGSTLYPKVYTRGENIFGIKNSILVIISVVGFFFLFRILIMKILKYKVNINKVNSKNCFNKKNFIICMVLMIICWIPYFLRYYPAIMTPDSYYSIHYVNEKILSDHHTFGHTWFFGFFYLIGKVVFSNSINAVALYTVVQMIINAFIFTKIIKFMYDRGVNKTLVFLIFLFLSLCPLYGFYSVTLWRDILFGCSFVLLFISLYEFVENGYKFTKFNLVNYVIAILFLLFFRNNGIYVFIFFLPFLLLFVRKRRQVFAISHILVIVLYFVIKGPVFDYFGVSKSITSEAYSIPLQQIARVVSLDLDINKKDYKYLSSIIDVEEAGDNYLPYISDPVKRMVDSKKLSKTKVEFFKVWFNIFLKHPRVYVEAYLCQTLGYWYPDVVYMSTGGESKSIFGDDVYTTPILKKYTKIVNYTTSRELPLSNLIWSLGGMFILYTFAIMLLIYKKEYKYLLPYIPIFCLWLSLVVASPVFCELRYIYGLFTCITLICVCPFLKKKN